MILAVMSVMNISANEENNVTVDSTSTVSAYVDSLLAFRSRQMADSMNSAKPLDPNRFRLFVPLTFYHSPVTATADGDKSDDAIASEVDQALMAMYLKRPDLVVETQTRLNKVGSVREDFEKPVKNEVDLSKAVEPMPEEPVFVPQGVVIQKPNFWTFKGDSYFQLLQNFVSDNWYKGGESNYSMVGQVTLNANYNNKSGIQMDNILELKLGFQTSPSDTVHKFKTNNDLIRYTGRFGRQATKRWYYSLQLLAYTQFTKGYKSNDKKVYSDFMSPFNLNIGIGMTYKVSALKNKLTGNINLSPFSYNWKYVDRKELASHYGIQGDHHSMDDYGSQVTGELQWTLSKQVTWKTRFYYYTTYKRTEIEWENNISLTISKYISSNIFIYPRYDDSVASDRDLGHWQFKEYCSLGLKYSF